MNKIIKIVEATRDEGQKEYAHDQDDVFANFNRVANLLEEDRKKAMKRYINKLKKDKYYGSSKQN